MNLKHWIAIGGWASNLNCWHSQLMAMLGADQIDYLCAHDWIAGRIEPDDKLSKLFSEPVGVISWSSGACLLSQWLTHNRRELAPGVSIIQLCPIFSFCKEGEGWSPESVRLLSKKISRNKARALEGFWQLCDPSASIYSELADAWLEQAVQYSEADLQLGLEWLEQTQVSPAGLEPYGKNLRFVRCTSDAVAKESLPEELSGFKNRLLSNPGHAGWLMSKFEWWSD